MDEENKNQCLFCNAIFSQKGYLKIHEDSIHKNIKFDCHDCGKQYAQKGNLRSHINNIHKGIRHHTMLERLALDKKSPGSFVNGVL